MAIIKLKKYYFKTKQFSIMKQLAIAFTLIFSSFFSQAQSPAYTKTMSDLVSQIQNAQFGEPLLPFANKLERIASAEPTEWLPNYWLAYCYINDAFSKPTEAEKDMMLDKAENAIKAINKLGIENDEISVIEANLASTRMSVNPMARWQTFGNIYQNAIQKATKQNPNNPRIYYLQGVNTFYTPENFGGGKKPAKALFEKAMQNFETFVLKSELHPNWGKGPTAYFLPQCD